MTNGDLYRIAAFAEPDALAGAQTGNPAGVWIGEALPEATAMQLIAAEVGYSETAFVAPTSGFDRAIRYFSPKAEVPFCGHATIATGVVLGKTSGDGVYRLQSVVGEVPVTVSRHAEFAEASLLSVQTCHEAPDVALLDQALYLLGWQAHELDASIPPAKAYAGAWHLVLAVAEQGRLASLDYDFEALKALMLAHDLTTLQLVWRESEEVFYSRNPFPVGGVHEDPATGAAAAALGGYLRDAGLLQAPARFIIRQGQAMHRPSLIKVDVPESGGVQVSGSAVEL